MGAMAVWTAIKLSFRYVFKGPFLDSQKYFAFGLDCLFQLSSSKTPGNACPAESDTYEDTHCYGHTPRCTLVANAGGKAFCHELGMGWVHIGQWIFSISALSHELFWRNCVFFVFTL